MTTRKNTTSATNAPKARHRIVYEALRDAIARADYGPGERLPSEIDLAERFETSRPTVARALRDLEAEGRVERRAGSGTYVLEACPSRHLLFGFLIPGLATTEIFRPICAQISREAHAAGHSMLWGEFAGETRAHGEEALRVCHSYIERQVNGVFFAPLELEEDQERANLEILDALEKAHIPVVLIDRDIVAFPERSRYDVIGIDNRRGGYLLARHLLALGCERVDFLARPRSASTVDLRIRGYLEALRDAGVEPKPEWVQFGDPEDEAFVKQVVDVEGARALVCANDVTAGRLMHTLDNLGRHVPEDVRVVAFDDVSYAKLLRVPLTTLRQPCNAIGTAALSAMLDRIREPDMPCRNIVLDVDIVVRRSCGSPPETRRESENASSVVGSEAQ